MTVLADSAVKTLAFVLPLPLSPRAAWWLDDDQDESEGDMILSDRYSASPFSVGTRLTCDSYELSSSPLFSSSSL